MNTYFSNVQMNEQAVVKVLDAFFQFDEHKNSPHLIVKSFEYLLTNQEGAKIYYRQVPNKEQIVEQAKTYIKNYVSENRFDYAREIADSILRFYPDRQKEILKYFDKESSTEPVDEKLESVYYDNQNVHNDSITASTINAATNLCLIYNDKNKKNNINEICDLLVNYHPKDEDMIRTSCKYIKDNYVRFGQQKILIADVFQALWAWITDFKYKRPQAALRARLIEELKEMKGMCSSGHIARLINVMQGFTDDERFIIKISVQEQCQTVIKNYLNTILAKEKDERILNGFLDKNNYFVNFIRKKIGEKLLEWRTAYGQEILPTIGTTVNQYCQFEIFKPRNG